MATPRTILGRYRLSSARILAWAALNPGLIALTVSVVAAGALAFFLVIVPPGTLNYP